MLLDALFTPIGCTTVAETSWGCRLMDILFLIITLLFFAASWGFVKLCERLMGGKA